MGDDAKHPNGLILSTDSYSVSNVIRLINILFIRSKLYCTLHLTSKGKPIISIK
jgi:hypothetical protein